MLAISATGTLSILDPAVIKRAPSSAPSCLTLIEPATSSVWSADNAFLFLSSAKVIHRYEPSSNSVKDFYTTGEAEEISHLLCRDKGSLVFSTGDKIHILDCGSTPKVSQTFESHKSHITSLSISNDSSLLASTSSNAVHVHNLSLGSHTVLRGLALAGQSITTSAFHPHTRTRLLLGVGKQLVIYDTTRPSGPLRVVPLSETTSGDIVAVACSPFSKTLVAVATSGGNVGLIDLDKEKGLFRTLNLKVPLTSIGFSPEGASVYLGTEHGKLLVMDLRALDKPPKTIAISETGCRIETMCVQKKIKAGLDSATKPATVTTSKSSTPHDAIPPRRPSAQVQAAKAGAKPAPSPARARVARVGSTASPGRRVPSTLKDSPKPATKKPNTEPEKKKVFSPVRDPLGNSAGDISESLSAMRGVTKVTPAKADRKTSISTRSRLSSSPRVTSGPTSISATSATSKRTSRGAESKEPEQPRRARTVPTAPRTRKTSTTTPAESVSTAATTGGMLTVPGESHKQIRSRSRAASSASRAGSEAVSAVSARSLRPSSSASRPGSSISPATSSPAPPSREASRTPSPDLPDMDLDPITPIPVAKRNRMGVLGLGTPEVDQWIRAGEGEDRGDRKGKGKGKSVGFKRDEEDEESDAERDVDHDELERERSLAMQVSPRRTGVGSSTSWDPSPVRRSFLGSPAGIGGGSAHDLLRTIVQDVMYDFQRENKAEMMGLHLDLVRMGRGWKKELRDLMDEYVGGLNELREENRRLREENEMLRRRGY